MSIQVLYSGDRIVGYSLSPWSDASNVVVVGDSFDIIESPWDWKSFDHVSEIASKLTAITGATFLPADQGTGISPRYKIVMAPVVGDAVSKSFNGDSYPCGYISKITPTWQITTSTGQRFRRYKQTAGWRETGRGFWMIHGHVYEQNPSF